MIVLFTTQLLAQLFKPFRRLFDFRVQFPILSIVVVKFSLVFAPLFNVRYPSKLAKKLQIKKNNKNEISHPHYNLNRI